MKVDNSIEKMPGYIRIDAFHQGNQDGKKRVGVINAVVEVMKFEIVLSCSRIREQFLITILTEMFDSFPLFIKGFYTENESEYINYQMVKSLNKRREILKTFGK